MIKESGGLATITAEGHMSSKKSLKKIKKVLDKPLTVCYIVYVEWLRDIDRDTLRVKNNA